jgi:hypothetical protein
MPGSVTSTGFTARKHPREIRLVAFDLLAIDGDDIRSQPLHARKDRLARSHISRVQGRARHPNSQRLTAFASMLGKPPHEAPRSCFQSPHRLTTMPHGGTMLASRYCQRRRSFMPLKSARPRRHAPHIALSGAVTDRPNTPSRRASHGRVAETVRCNALLVASV